MPIHYSQVLYLEIVQKNYKLASIKNKKYLYGYFNIIF